MSVKKKIQVEKVTEPIKLEEVFAIRTQVFVIEQQCIPELEKGFEDESVHFLATVDSAPAGASRWRKTKNGYKLERICVLPEFRGLGVGKGLVQGMLQDLPSDAGYIYLHAQVQATGLYENFGFVKVGSPFEEAGIMHCKMETSSIANDQKN